MSKTRKDYSPRRKEPREESFNQKSHPVRNLRPTVNTKLSKLDPSDEDTLESFADEFPSFEKI